MLLQVALLNKSPLAHVTLPGLLAAMQHEMMLQICLLDECFAAEGASELRQSVQSFELLVGCPPLLLCRRREDLVFQRKGVGSLHLKRDSSKQCSGSGSESGSESGSTEPTCFLGIQDPDSDPLDRGMDPDPSSIK
jgi:hypothetical protein